MSNDLENLTDIAIEIKLVNEYIKWSEDMSVKLAPLYKGDTTKLEIQITNLENRRKRIVRKMFNQYCK
ncbi:MAG: hypothetical protein ACUZ8E_07115 [Candidatus Anammoxibacter sp.]